MRPSCRRDSEQQRRSSVAQAVWESTAEGTTFSRVGARECGKCLCKSAVFSDDTLAAVLKREGRMKERKKENYPK